MRANGQKIHKGTTGKTRVRTRILKLRFDTSETDQLIYNALKACSDRCRRKPISGEAGFLIALALCGREKLANEIDFESLRERLANGFENFLPSYRLETSGPPKLRLVPRESKED